MIEMEALGWIISIDPSAVLAPGMFLVLILALLSGFPVAFCLGGVGVIFAALGILSGEIDPQFFTALPQRILGTKIVFALQPDNPGLRGHAVCRSNRVTGWSGHRSPSGVVGPFSLFRRVDVRFADIPAAIER